MQVQHDARAGRARRGERAPAERRLDVVGVHDARAGALARRAPTSSGASPPRSSPSAARRAAERRRVALQHLGLLAQLGADQPREVLDRPLLPARHAVAVVSRRITAGSLRRRRLTSSAPWHPPPRSSSRRATGARTSPSRSRPSPARRPRTAPRSSWSRTAPPTRRPSGWPPRTGARYVALGAPARAQRRAQRGGRRGRRATCSASSTTTSRPGPDGSRAMLAAAAAHPGHEAFGGPIRARLEGTNLHACGREPLPVTTLDLGAGRPRRRARVGREPRRCAARRSSGSARSTPRCPGPGDEEEWERRLRAAGGRIRYVAAAGVDHRRTGAGRAHRRPLARRLAPRAPRAPLRRGQGHRAGRSRASCARSPAASGTPAATAAGTGSCSPRRPRAGCARRAEGRPVKARRHLRRDAARRARRTCRGGPGRSGGARCSRAARATPPPTSLGAPAAPRGAARRAHGAAAAAGARRRRRAAGARGRSARAIRAELARSRHDVALHLDPGAARPRQVGEPARHARRAPARRRRLAADRRRRRRAARRLPRRVPARRRALRAAARPARARVRLARRLAGHAPPARRCSPAARASSRSAP